MTDRIKGFVVTLARDMRDDDAEPTLGAIRMIRGVVSVEPIVSESWVAQMERNRMLDRLRTSLEDMMEDLRTGKE